MKQKTRFFLAKIKNRGPFCENCKNCLMDRLKTPSFFGSKNRTFAKFWNFSQKTKNPLMFCYDLSGLSKNPAKIFYRFYLGFFRYKKAIFFRFCVFENSKSEFYRIWKSHAFYREKVSKNVLFWTLFWEQTPPKKSTFLIILLVLGTKFAIFSK